MERELTVLSENIKELLEKGSVSEAKRLICGSMSEYPDSAAPHNLMGILLEKENDHVGAMKHFRAAYALDPTFVPARFNMEQYGGYEPRRACAYFDTDCGREPESPFEIRYDEKNVGRLVRKTEGSAQRWSR